jgi:hypothetical protein
MLWNALERLKDTERYRTLRDARGGVRMNGCGTGTGRSRSRNKHIIFTNLRAGFSSI